jgi:hypothetical protein
LASSNPEVMGTTSKSVLVAWRGSADDASVDQHGTKHEAKNFL